jgi:transposase
MKCAVKLSEAEDISLQQLSLNYQDRDKRTRPTVVMLLGRKLELTEVTWKLGVSGQSVYSWAHAWHNKACGLLVDRRGRRPLAASDALVATATEAARAEAMTLKQIAQHVEEVQGVRFPCRLDTLSGALKRGWSSIGEPHRVFPQPHCTRSVLGAFDFGANLIEHEARKATIKRPAVVRFLDQIDQDAPLTVVALDNVLIHYNIDHRMVLFSLPPYNPELKLIGIVWRQAKYHCRRFVTWSKETIDAEIANLLNAYRSRLQIDFS